jgi:hypothetical protein
MKKSFLKIQSKPIFKDLRDKLAEYLFLPSRAQIFKVPNFDKLTDSHINEFSLIKPHMTYRNNIYWTPRFYIQKDISREFLFELKKFRKLEEWTEMDYFALTQLIITEAIRDTTYSINYNEVIKPTYNNPFHGTIEMLIFNTEEGSK